MCNLFIATYYQYETSSTHTMSSGKITGAVILIAMFIFIMFRSKSVGNNKAWANFSRWRQSALVLLIGLCLVLSMIWCVVSWFHHFSSKDPDETIDGDEIVPIVVTVVIAMMFFLARWWKKEVAGMSNHEAGRWSRLTFFLEIVDWIFRN